jgi:hypothetical protein
MEALCSILLEGIRTFIVTISRSFAFILNGLDYFCFSIDAWSLTVYVFLPVDMYALTFQLQRLACHIIPKLERFRYI